MRRVLLVNALIFAVLAAAVALAYYSYSYTSEASSREREIIRDTMRDLADEKISNIEASIVGADLRLFGEIQLDRLSDLDAIVKAADAPVRSVFVLDEKQKVVPDGYEGTRASKDAIEFRDYFEAKVVPQLQLQALAPGVRGHLHDTGSSSLFSFEKKVVGDRTFYIVIEEDLYHLLEGVFPQYFAVTSSPRLYQVVDDRGQLVFGPPFSDLSGGVSVSLPFVDTVDAWTVRVAQRDAPSQGAGTRRRVLDSLTIGVAITVILAGLGFLTIAIRRERRANELKSEFISNVSHELKTPLSIISMFGEMLAQRRTKSPEQATEYAEIIWRESVRLGRLIDNVLDFAKIERGMGVYEFEEADLADVVARAVELSQRRLAAASMTLDVELAPDLPPVRLDPNAFTLAVLNLIDNAIKYAPDGKRIELKLARAATGDRIELSVRDFGPGIDAAEHAQIFERFYRARAVRLKPIRGSGIGLALVQHIARAHHGDVVVESEPGQGAVFRIWLPVSTS